MIFHAISYKREESFHKNILKFDKIITAHINNNDDHFFLLGELIFDEYNLSKDNIDANKFSQSSDKMTEIRHLAIKHQCYLSLGYIEEDMEHCYNAQVVVDKTGEILHNHRKQNLTKKEQNVFKNGESPVTSFHIDDVRYSISICYDLFSRNFRKDYLTDSSVLLHSLTDPQDGRFTLGYSGRYTSSKYIASNRFSDEYNGHIGIYSENGKRMAFSMNKENIVSKQFDMRKKAALIPLINYVKVFFHFLRFLRKSIQYLKWSKENK